MRPMEGTLELLVRRKIRLAEDIHGFDLEAANGGDLPAYAPGAHIALSVPSGQKRRYSLCEAPGDPKRYSIAVKREARGRGGSASLIDRVVEGDVLRADPPDNEFAMAAAAPKKYVFVAGGIGITPIRSMIRDLERRGLTNWTLRYLTRSPEATAFRDEFADPRATIHHDGGDPGRAFDLWPLLENPDGAHLYCCGPRGLMDSVRDMTGHWPDGTVRFEDFGAPQAGATSDAEFEVRLARAGRTFRVAAGVSILDTLRRANLPVASSCESGSCGTCRTGLLEGDADHRDFVLLDDEKRSAIMICVSRAKTPFLVLDL